MENTETNEQRIDVAAIYDANATQKIPVGEGVYAVVKPYSDERFTEYRKDFVKSLNEIMKKGDGANLEEAEIKQAIENDCALCDELLDALEGYADLPADWKALISAEDKLAIIRKALNFVIDEESEKLSLGQLVVPTACYFNGEVARQSHVLRRKTIDDSSRYALLKSKDYKVTPARKFGADKQVEITPQDEGRIALYDDMRQSATGFANDKVPSRVKILVIDHIFSTAVDNQKK